MVLFCPWQGACMEQEPSQAQEASQFSSLDRKCSINFIFPFLPEKSYTEQEIHTNSIYQKGKNTNPNQNKKNHNCLNQTRTSIQTENKVPCPILKLYIKSKVFICHLLSFLHQKASSSCWLSSSQPWSLSSGDYCTKGGSQFKSQSWRSQQSKILNHIFF